MNARDDSPKTASGSAAAGSVNRKSFKTSFNTNKKRRISMKRLVVPETTEQLEQLEDMYEWDPESFMDSMFWRRPRPLPSVATLATLPAASMSNSGLNMPLLDKFRNQLKADDDVAKDGSEDSMMEETDGPSEQHDNKLIMLPMDDVTLSTLSEGQHRRFLQLQQEKTTNDAKWNEAKSKEYKRLSERVAQEQEMYKQAVASYMEENLKAFLVGFDGKPGVSSLLASLYSERWVSKFETQWMHLQKPCLFGKCVQTISLPQQKIDDDGNAAQQLFRLESLILNKQVVHTTRSESSSLVTVDLASVQANVPTSLTSAMSADDNVAPTLLRDDPVAHELARTHNIDLVTTKETLQALLRLPGHVMARLVLPLSTVTDQDANRTKWLDLPVPSSSTPRECLTWGYEAALIDCLKNQSQGGSKVAPSPSRVETVYTILTLGNSRESSRHQRVKVLCKTVNHFATLDGNPLMVYAQLDYFQARPEEFTAFQKACWILDKMLQPSCRVLVGRTCPNTAQLQAWEEQSIASALTPDWSETSASVQQDPLYQISSMVHLLNGMLLLDQGEQMLCWPARDVPAAKAQSCLSVHRDLPQDSVPIPLVDLAQEFQEAVSVYTGQAALKACIQPWKWNHAPDRVPYTFPVRESKRSTATVGKTHGDFN